MNLSLLDDKVTINFYNNFIIRKFFKLIQPLIKKIRVSKKS